MRKPVLHLTPVQFIVAVTITLTVLPPLLKFAAAEFHHWRNTRAHVTESVP